MLWDSKDVFIIHKNSFVTSALHETIDFPAWKNTWSLFHQMLKFMQMQIQPLTQIVVLVM